MFEYKSSDQAHDVDFLTNEGWEYTGFTGDSNWIQFNFRRLKKQKAVK